MHLTVCWLEWILQNIKRSRISSVQKPSDSESLQLPDALAQKNCWAEDKRAILDIDLEEMPRASGAKLEFKIVRIVQMLVEMPEIANVVYRDRPKTYVCMKQCESGTCRAVSMCDGPYPSV